MMRRTADQIADELLVLGSQAGDTTAWRRLVERWQPRLFAQAFRLAGTREGAADITQESWLAIVRSLRRLDDPARFRFWARRIVANKSADWVRQGGRWVRAQTIQTRGLNRNRHPLLKAVFKGAATTVIRGAGDHPLYQDYQRMLQAGIKPNLAKLTLARRIAAAVLSMWKHREVYDPKKQCRKHCAPLKMNWTR